VADAEKKDQVKCYNSNTHEKKSFCLDLSKRRQKDPYELRAMKNAKDKIRTRLVHLNGSNMN
jgi:hypothetical protein